MTHGSDRPRNARQNATSSSEGDEDPATKHNGLAYLPAPRAKLPTHGDSYNPPFEYRADTQVDENGDEISTPRRFYDALRRVALLLVQTVGMNAADVERAMLVTRREADRAKRESSFSISAAKAAWGG